MLSIIFPSYNEESMLLLTAKTVGELMVRENIPCELIFVDDGSRDGTWAAICAAQESDRRVTGVRFSRNFGKEAAIFAGLKVARGECCAVMDCDLQHPPEKLVEMYRLWQEGYEVVEGVKESRGEESGTHAFAANAFYRIISRASKLDLADSSDFKLLDRKVVDTLNAMPERGVFFRALSYWVGFRRTTVPYAVGKRLAGESKWSTRALIRYALVNITSFSAAPMQVVTWIGALFSLFAVILGIQTLVNKLSGVAADGFTTVILLQLLGCGLIMISLGIIGFYIARIYEEIKGRPRYIIAELRREET